MRNSFSPIKFSTDSSPQLIVVIDTEEEFDWFDEPKRESDTVHHIESIHLVQDIFNEYGIHPCYVVDYPIASKKKSIDVLSAIHNEGLCEIGTHLHPWVNPPFNEALSQSNMFPGNLPKDVEFEKLSVLSQKINESFGIVPRIYKAGRYGLGPNTRSALLKLGYDIDLSVCSGFDYSSSGGPDFSDYPTEPYWLEGEDDILEIPLTGAFVGWAGPLSSQLYSAAGTLNKLKARAILSRIGAVDRLMLSPEGYSTKEHIKITQYLLNKGVRTFTWNFHSPSVVPGMTMYTKTEKDLVNFLDSFRRYFDFFFDRLRGSATTPTRLKEQMEKIT